MATHRKWVLGIAMGAALFFLLTACAQALAHFSPPFSCGADCVPLSLIVREERLSDGAQNDLPPLEDGDILLTDCAHSFGWRHGHAALVLDGRLGLTLEAVTVGVPSDIQSAQRWRRYPTFTVMRLKNADPVTRRAVAEYALEHLRQVPYRLTSGLFDDSLPSELSGSQCAYLVWYAYRQFGYDLDSDGGRLVTVEDLRRSPYLEVVARVGDPSPANM